MSYLEQQKSSEEIYRIALSHERGDKYAKTYVSIAGGSVGTTTATAGGLQIKTEPLGVIRGQYRNNRGRGRGQVQGRGQFRGGVNANDRRCYNCDSPGFTEEHMSQSAAKSWTCSFCKKVGHFERTCRAKHGNRGRQSVGMFQEQEVHNQDNHEGIEHNISQHENLVGWVNTPTQAQQQHSWDSDSSGDYLAMSIRSKNERELRVAGFKLPMAINGKKTRVWIDSASPISILTIEELKRTLGAAGVNLCDLTPKDQDFRSYGNNPPSLLRTMKVQFASNGWKTKAVIKVIERNRLSIIGRDLMAELGLQLVQKALGEQVMAIHEETAKGDDKLDQWQDCFSEQFSNLFTQVGEILNYKV